MHLISLEDLDAGRLRALVAGREGGRRSATAGWIAVLDFLPLGADRVKLAAAVAATGGSLTFGAELFPGFPARTDLLAAAEAVGAYADLVVLRHPLKGAARAAAAVSRAPVLNAGDGAGEDPVFALADLAALQSRLGGLEGRCVALCGDLRRNRRAHSLAGGLLACGARVLLVPARGAEPGDGLLDRLALRHGHHPVRFEARSMSSLLDMVDSWLLTPDLDHQLSLLPDLVATDRRERRLVRGQVREVHAMWVAAERDERGEPVEGDAAELPWRGEEGRSFVSPARPGDGPPGWAERAPAEVAALRALLAAARGEDSGPVLPDDGYLAREGLRCDHPGCVACREPVRVRPAFVLARTDPVLLSCVYCWTRRKARYVGSRREKRFHRLTSSQVKKILPRNTVFFASREEAETAGFVPSRI